jgi:PIN domain nuclease of toxin-antitoxin system
MRLLLDTHIFLWWVTDNRKLSKAVRSRITQATEVYISSASIWELAIKIKLKKLNADIAQLAEEISNSGFSELPITGRHASFIYHLPLMHRDPFDRIMIAQAICEPLTLITCDSILQKYSELVELVE